MNLDLTDVETTVLLRELDHIIDGALPAFAPRPDLEGSAPGLGPTRRASHQRRGKYMSLHRRVGGDGARATSAAESI
jgi:hypothetical protein